MQESERSAKRVVQLLAVVIVLVGLGSVVIGMTDAVGLTNVVRARVPVTLTTYAQLVSAFGSLVLTLGLVILYYQQTRIQQRQESWMEAEHVPDLFVRQWRLNRNQATFTVENLGTGLARDVRVEIRVNLSGVSDTYLSRSRVGQSETFASVVRASDDQTEVSGMIRHFDYGGSESVRTEDMLERIDGENEVSITISLLYECVRQRDTSELVFEWTVTPDAPQSLEDLVVQRHEQDVPDAEIPPKNPRSEDS